MTDPVFVYTTHIASTPEAVYQALTTAEFTEQYWGGSALESDWQVGSQLVERNARQEGFYGEVLRAEPPRELSYTFQTSGNEAEGNPPTRVLFEIGTFGPVVTLTVTHDSFPADEAGIRFRREISQGWPAILSSLKTPCSSPDSRWISRHRSLQSASTPELLSPGW